MNRALLLIGVSRTGGNLARLKAVEDSIDRLQEWATKHQRIPPERIIRCTDAHEPVTIARLYKAIQTLIELDDVEQLIVYFAGHGIVNNRCEYWLLSQAPENGSEAVNIESNVSLAQAGAFPHVVFLSDACRTPANTVQLGRVVGADIFPNILDAEQERSVDIFFATSLGAPALEVAQAVTAEQYQAVFTEALLEALNGEVQEAILEGKVRPRPLKRVLPKKVREKLNASGVSLSTSQSPDARITSDEEAWLADIPSRPVAAAPGTTDDSRPEAPTPAPAGTRLLPTTDEADAAARPSTMSTREVAKLMVSEALAAPRTAPATRDELERLTTRRLSANAGRFLESMTGSAAVARGAYRSVRQGFEVIGRTVTRAICPDGACRTTGDSVDVDTDARQTSALLEFEDETGALLPVIAGHVGILRFNDGALDEVWYEPAGEDGYAADRDDLDFLRKAIVKASALGVFSLDGAADAERLASRMRALKFRDPALAVYAAYAYYESGQIKRITQMQSFLSVERGVQLYDLALLSRGLLKDEGLAARVVPRLPLLSQGWALVNALHGRVPGELGGLRTELAPSLWSLYRPAGTALIRQWLREQGHWDTLTTGAGT